MPIVTEHRRGTPCWVDLASPDLFGSRAFYGALFGWTFDDLGDEFGGYGLARKNGRQVAGLGPMPPEAYPMWTVYLATPDADADSASAVAHGGTVIVPMMEVGPMGKMTILTDVTGAVFGLWQAGVHHGAELTGEPGSFAWAEVCTRDAEQTRKFYTDVFGITSNPVREGGYFVFGEGDEMSHGVLPMDSSFPADVPPNWFTYFAVSDVDASSDQVVALGGTVFRPAFDTPWGRIALVSDPQGARFAIMTLPQG